MTLRRSFWPTAITLFGAFLRWHRLGDTRVWWDFSYPIAQAQLLLSRGEWPTLGQATTFFISNPPGQAYLSLAPLLAFQSPWGVHWLMATLNALAIPLVYRVGHSLFNEPQARVGAFLFAVSPWVVSFSRTTYSGSLIPFFTALILFWLTPVLLHSPDRNRSRNVLVALVTLSIFAQTYLLALLIAPIQVVLLLLLCKRRIPWRAAVAGGAVWAAGVGVFGYNSARDWASQAIRLSSFFGREGQPHFQPGALRLAAGYVTGLEFHPPGTSAWRASGGVLPHLYEVAGWVLMAALIIGIGQAVGDCLRRNRYGIGSAALIIWWVIPIALLSYNKYQLHDWHLVLTLPAGHMLAARGIGWLNRWPRLKPLWLGAGALAAGLSFLAFNSGSLYNSAHPAEGDLDRVTLHASLLLGSEAAEQTSAYGVGEVYAALPPPTLTAWARRPLTTVSWFIDPELLIVPQGRPAVYMRLGHGAAPAPYPMAERVETIAFPGDDVVAFDVFPALDRPAMLGLPRVPLDWPSDTGLTLLGYTASDGLRAGGTVTVTTYWLAEALVEARGDFIYGPYMHLDAVDGPVHLNVSAPGLPGYYYRMGDLYVQPLTFTLPEDAPAGEYRLELGLYDGVHSVGTTFHPPDGDPVPFHVTALTVP